MKRLFWIAILIWAVGETRAQYDVAFTNYWTLQSFYNPAAAGSEGQLNIRGAYSMQMVGFDGGGKTMLVTADMPLFFINNNHGAGAGFMNDEIGLISTKRIYLQYAYHKKLRKNHKVSAGFRFVVLSEAFNHGNLDLNDKEDPAFPKGDATGFGVDMDFGVRYAYKDIWHAGVSVMHLMAPTISLGEEKLNELSVPRSFFVMGGYKHKFNNPVYTFCADAMMQTDMQTWRADVTGRLCYEGAKNKMYGGISYSPTISVGMLFGIDFHGVSLGYSYEIYTGIGAINGTHELTLGYQMDMASRKKGKNLHKSVRFL